MCSEGKPEACHRCKLIGVTLTTQDIPVIHIDENGEQVTQEKVVERLTGGNCRCLVRGRTDCYKHSAPTVLDCGVPMLLYRCRPYGTKAQTLDGSIPVEVVSL